MVTQSLSETRTFSKFRSSAARGGWASSITIGGSASRMRQAKLALQCSIAAISHNRLRLILAEAIEIDVHAVGNQAIQNCKHDARGEPEQEQAVDCFERAQKLPALGYMNVPVTQ